MNKLIASNFTSPTVGFPVKSGTWDFIQNAYKEGFSAVVQGLIGDVYDPTLIYRLWGVKLTPAGSYTTVSDGAVYYDGEVYLVDAQTNLNTLTYRIVPTNYTDGTKADPVIYTDGNSHNVHNIRKMTFPQSTIGDTPLTDVLVDMPYATTTTFGVSASSAVLKFENDKVLILSAVSGTTNLTLDTTRAYVGATHTVYFASFGGSGTLNINAGSGQTIYKSGVFSVNSDEITVVVKYLGVNPSTGDESFLAYQTTQI